MAVQIQIRRDTAANWVTNDPVLAEGEFGHETDATVLKIGDGATLYSALPNLLTGTVAFGEYRGIFDASIGTFPVTINQGDWFNCTVAGTVDTETFTVGDILIALVDAPSTTIFAANWTNVPNVSVTDHTLLTNIGVNTHAQIDAHIADGAEHAVVVGGSTIPSSTVLTLTRSGGLADITVDLTNILEAEVALAREIDDDRPANNFIYIGEAIPGSGATSAAVWRIKRLEFLSVVEDDIEQLWADGDANFDNIWDDRTSLTYTNT